MIESDLSLTQSQVEELKKKWSEQAWGEYKISPDWGTYKIKVLLFYVVYPMAIGTYFKKALEHRDDVDLRVVGPYTANWMPWLNGLTVPMKYAIPPDIALPFAPNVGEVNYDLVRASLGDWIPDIIINVDAGLHFKYKPTDGMVVTVATDPHVLGDWYNSPRSYSDKFFNMQKVYSKGKDVYLPYAYSKYDCYPDDSVSKDLDAAIIGLQYTHVPRVQLVEELRKRGLNVFAENGPIFDEARAIYNRTHIGLNWSTMDDLNCRAFELPAMKLFPVMNWVTDMAEFPINTFGDVFHTIDEAIEIAMWAKENPELAHKQAEIAYNLIQPHTFDSRVEQLLKECGFV